MNRADRITLSLTLAALGCIVLGLLVQRASNWVFGCQDALVEVKRSPDAQHDAVVRKCGCSAQTSRYTLVYVTPPGGETSCEPTHPLALVNAGGEHALTVAWMSTRQLSVSLNGMRYESRRGAVNVRPAAAAVIAPPDVPIGDGVFVVVDR